jgi:hypothetical protein
MWKSSRLIITSCRFESGSEVMLSCMMSLKSASKGLEVVSAITDARRFMGEQLDILQQLMDSMAQSHERHLHSKIKT